MTNYKLAAVYTVYNKRLGCWDYNQIKMVVLFLFSITYTICSWSVESLPADYSSFFIKSGTTAWIRRSTSGAWGVTTKAGARGTTLRTRTDHHSISGKSGHIEQWNQHPSYPTIEFYHIDNPNNDPIVIHFKTFDYTVCFSYYSYTDISAHALRERLVSVLIHFSQKRQYYRSVFTLITISSP